MASTTTSTTTSTTLPPSTACVKTTVINTSGATRWFDFLPPQGATLANNAEFTDFGTPMDWIGAQGSIHGRENLIKSLQYALLNNWITIKSTPAPFLYDATTGKVKTLTINNGNLQVADPCYDGEGPRVNVNS